MHGESTGAAHVIFGLSPLLVSLAIFVATYAIIMTEKLKLVEMDEAMLQRSVNSGFCRSLATRSLRGTSTSTGSIITGAG